MKKIISIMLCIMLSVSMMTACGSKESDNDKKDVGSETKQDAFTYDLKGVTVAMNENMEPRLLCFFLDAPIIARRASA